MFLMSKSVQILLDPSAPFCQSLCNVKGHMHIFIMSTTSLHAWLQKDSLKTVGGIDYTNSIPYSMTNGWMDKINSSSIKNPHAHLQYVHSKYARFQTDPLKTVRAAYYTNYIAYNAKNCVKLPSLKGHNSVKINSISIKNPHAHH